MSGAVVDRLQNYLNPDAFLRPAIDTFGSAPRYLNARGSGIKSLDAALLKSFFVKEGTRAEFRLEANNATKTPNFSDPATMWGASNFGQLREPRSEPAPFGSV